MSIHHPHDKLFRAVFSDPIEATSFFEAYLPEALKKYIDWKTLVPKENSFVDEEFKHVESDLWYQVKLKDSENDLFLYILFEHQSKPDKFMRFRLLKYMCRIWDESLKDYPKQDGLIPILPIVFYQGETNWNYSNEFSDLFLYMIPGANFYPAFKHVLIDQSRFQNHDIKGDIKAKIAQLLMRAAFHGNIREIFDLLGKLIAKLPETGGINYIRVFIFYLVATQESKTVVEFADLMQKHHSTDFGGQMVTLAQEWFSEGEARGEKRGEVKGKLEIIENFLKTGIGWDIIYKATGINQESFQELKKKLQSFGSNYKSDDV